MLREIAERHKIKIKELSVMPNHIHMVVGIPPPTMSVSRAFQLLKGTPSRELFGRKPDFRLRYLKGHLWSPGKFYGSVGDTDAEAAIQYVCSQQLQQISLDAFPSTTNRTSYEAQLFMVESMSLL